MMNYIFKKKQKHDNSQEHKNLPPPKTQNSFSFLTKLLLCWTFHMFDRGQKHSSFRGQNTWPEVLSLTREMHQCTL